jgi:pimeloyl-ACP methyl ester carboxylesterase
MGRLQTKFVEHSGIRTSYYDEGAGPTLLLLHGFTGSKLDFHDQLDWFSGSFRVVVPDNRGHGESSNTGIEADYTLDLLAADLDGFIEALELDDIHLLGHSLGGMVVMRYALLRPEKLASLILMDTTPAPLNLPSDKQEFVRATIQKSGLLGLAELQKAASKSREVQNGIDYLGEADLPFVEPSKSMADTISGATLEIIESAEHCPQYENADRWRQAISAHLARV